MVKLTRREFLAVSRRAKKEPPKEGGWNLFHTWAISLDVMIPALNAGIAGS